MKRMIKVSEIPTAVLTGLLGAGLGSAATGGISAATNKENETPEERRARIRDSLIIGGLLGGGVGTGAGLMFGGDKAPPPTTSATKPGLLAALREATSGAAIGEKVKSIREYLPQGTTGAVIGGGGLYTLASNWKPLKSPGFATADKLLADVRLAHPAAPDGKGFLDPNTPQHIKKLVAKLELKGHNWAPIRTFRSNLISAVPFLGRHRPVPTYNFAKGLPGKFGRIMSLIVGAYAGAVAQRGLGGIADVVSPGGKE